MSKTKLSTIHRSVILAAAARSADHVVADEQRDDGNRAAGAVLCRDGSAREEAREEAEADYELEIDRLAGLSPLIDERLRRHVIRDLAASPRLRALATRYLRDIAAPRVGGVDPREGGLLITSYGADWRSAPAVHLAA